MPEGKISFEELEATTTQQTTATSAGTVAAIETQTAQTTETQANQDTKPQFTEADVQAYKSLVDMGITPQNAQEFKAAKTALENLPILLKTNPGLLMDEIEKNDPQLHAQLLENFSDRWFSRLPSDVREGKSGNSSASSTANSVTDPRLDALQKRFDQFIEKQNQEETTRTQNRISEGYTTSIDGLIAKLPESVSTRDKDYIRLKTNELLWKDNAARERIAKGVYVDVPTYFSKAASLVTAETKAAANAEHERRSTVEKNGVRQIPAASENVNGSSAKSEGHGHDPIWGDISSDELKSAYK